MRREFVLLPLLVVFVLSQASHAQMETATLSGRVTDPDGAIVVGVRVQATHIETNTIFTTETNAQGLYVISNLRPGRYRISVRQQGFREIVKTDLVLRVQDSIAHNFTMQVGSIAESITVVAERDLMQTTPAVATVVDRTFVENLPLNGRSFNALLELTPGVVLARTDFQSQGQFSVSGQRTNTNYYMVDGVSANVGASPGIGAGMGQEGAGSLPALTALGGTSNLVSVDALQEFRIQTSTYAPEFGRTPGGQISLVTRAGANRLHGTLSHYFRNDILDAHDWFANRAGLPKPALRQNNFAAVLGGPIVRDQAFFFFSYEGLRLRQPQFRTISVPSNAARDAAPPEIQPYLRAFPIPNGPELDNGMAQFSATYSNPSTIDAAGLRLDYTPTSNVTFFGRYNYAPSKQTIRGLSSVTLSTLIPSEFVTQTVTLGSTWAPRSTLSNDLRVNWSEATARSRVEVDDFGGAVPIADNLAFPPFAEPGTGIFSVGFFISPFPTWQYGANVDNSQRQINVVNATALVRGTHQFKFGVDYRLLSPFFGPRPYTQNIWFANPLAAASGDAFQVIVAANRPLGLRYANLSLFGQDTWRANQRLTLTYGLRWEINPPPSGRTGTDLFTVRGLENPATITLAPPGTPMYETTYGNFAPRVGIAYQFSDQEGWQSVFRGGFGIFYDLGNSAVGRAAISWPHSAARFSFGVPVPLTGAAAEPPPFATEPPVGTITVTDPELKLPRSYQFNVSWEQSVAGSQSFSLTYVGAVGRRLLRTQFMTAPNPSFGRVDVIRNQSTSDYHALQAQFQRHLVRGLQGLAGYTWSHSIDTASEELLEFSQPVRGPSNFDVRHSFVGAITYELPRPRGNPALDAVLGNWSVDAIVRAQSAYPVDLLARSSQLIGGAIENVRPNVVPGEPFYVSDPNAPGGRIFNRNAFEIPPVGQFGNLGRNALRGFGISQVDFALRRHIPLTERVNLQFRTEFFNLFNRPNFGPPVRSVTSAQFGQATQMAGRSFGSGGVNGGFNPLYQVGGPRSIQFAARLQF